MRQDERAFPTHNMSRYVYRDMYRDVKSGGFLGEWIASPKAWVASSPELAMARLLLKLRALGLYWPQPTRRNDEKESEEP